MKILIVEDDMILALINKKFAIKLGHEIINTVTNSEEAIDFCTNNAPEVIFMDIHIDGKYDGIETMQEIRKFSNTPVIYISANSDKSTYNRALSVSDSYFLLKPIDIEKLRTTLDEISINIHQQ